ncbi:SusC/RagA family TonB-linked outer membrane protein [Pseudoflavitalea sp. G-6-1-2]|uniref:SusC/RagA family TonB-linked outer membrane protein n=1 Tax=Pseudoflavitalea sp. G-6-1-2 TaxID=2728841 RepID=UPI00146DD6EB|nr:SusC/RagA family TonB-linked outer membrane protein [Pseudoflavitalea sp. G-6-1-2]NML21483.1 SusC/RagA family TonB-linked outer membrane protein [Pseudoflavitalea sp. G-6-1-2]
MKLIALLMFAGCLQVSAKGYAQKITLHEKNAPLQKIFKEIKKQSGYFFLYTDELIRDTRNTDVNVKNVSLEDALDEAFRDQPLTFTIVNRTIIIKRKAAQPLFPELVIQQRHSIRGTVLDADNKPVADASVVLNGTKYGTSTNANGEFVFGNIPEGEYELSVSSVGFGKYTQKVKLKGESITLNIALSKSASRLDEIVVTAYGTSKQSNVTGSVSTVSSKLLEHSPRPSVQENLQGNVSGVIVSTGSGQPGYSGNVRIRGIGSINGGNVPLYVVDGIPLIAGDLNSINASDVQSISVLKDASAASLYGSRAANGVIIITTKKGGAGKTVFNASVQAGSNTITNAQASKPLNTLEMLELLREGLKNNTKIKPTDFENDLKKAAPDTTVNTDWFDALIRNGSYSQFDLSASGGSDKTKFFASASYYNAIAPMLGSDFKRYSARLNLSNQASQRLSLNLTLNASATKSNLVKDEGSFANPVRAYKRYQPWLRVYKDDGTYDLSYSNNYNPVAVVKENKFSQDRYSFLGSFGAKFSITEGLTIETQNSVDFKYSENLDYAESGIGTARSNGGIANQETGRIMNLVSTNIIRYKKQFDLHGFEAFAGYEAQKVQSVGLDVTKRNFIPNMLTLANAAAVDGGKSTESNSTLVGMFTNVSYSYDGKYNLSASFRRDGSSRFGANQQYGNFWSVGASWNIAQEGFMAKQNIFSDLRLRLSYGSNGNQSIDDFASRGLYSNTAIYDNNPGMVLDQYGNAELTWEKNNPFNVGVDFGILRNRLQGSVEYYVRSTAALLLNRPVSATNGVTSVLQNIGSMQNSGIEIELNSSNIVAPKSGGFSWNTRAMFATLKNKITKLESPMVGTFNRYEGGDFYQFNLPGFVGADPETGEALWYTDATKGTTTNEFNKAKAFNQGSALPKFYTGLTNTFDYKGISLSFQLYGSFGNKIYDNWGSNSFSDGSAGFGATSAMPRYYYNNRWKEKGDMGKQPKVMYNGSQSGASNQGSTRFLYDGDFIRLRDVTLGYDLSKQLISKLHLSSARVYVRANNLYTWLKDERVEFDPEVGIEGYADQNAPVFKTILIGLDIKF